ncbi:hypothetical protein C8J57DRAFT_1513992 [Mycena rebaudengoi]|nr:hypothetical protein C8J57DRAFT_1513992 [Mycena rebaudengoi]
MTDVLLTVALPPTWRTLRRCEGCHYTTHLFFVPFPVTPLRVLLPVLQEQRCFHALLNPCPATAIPALRQSAALSSPQWTPQAHIEPRKVLRANPRPIFVLKAYNYCLLTIFLHSPPMSQTKATAISQRAARSAKHAASQAASDIDDPVTGDTTSAPPAPVVEATQASSTTTTADTADTAPVSATPPTVTVPVTTATPANMGEVGDTSTPTPMPAPSMPASLSPCRSSFPPPPSPGIESMPSHAARRKSNKGKGKAKAVTCSPSLTSPPSPTPSATTTDLFGAYDEEAELRTPAHPPPVAMTTQGLPPRPLPSASAQTPQVVPFPGSVHAPSILRRTETHPVAPSPPSLPVDSMYGMTTSCLFRNVPSIQQRQWDEVEHPKIVCTVSGSNGEQRCSHRPALPDPCADPRRNGPDPIAWLIGGLLLDQAQSLLHTIALCSNTITAFFHAYRAPITGYVGTYQSFTIHPDNGALARRIIVGTIEADPTIGRFVRAHRDTFPAHMTAHDAFDTFCDSIGIADIQLLSPSGPFTGWNVYVTSPTTNEDDFEALCRLFANLIINTPFHGQGRIFHCPLHCNICLTTDHPTNLCPFPNTPGWLGPTPETIGALLEASRDALNPSKKKSARDAKKGFDGKGKGKDRDDRKGRDRRRG